MVVSNYDSFLDPRTWPEAEEIDRLRAIYGWNAMEPLGVVAPHGHPPGAGDAKPKQATSKYAEVQAMLGAPGAIRTPDPQVRSQSGEPEMPPESPEDPSPGRTEPD